MRTGGTLLRGVGFIRIRTEIGLRNMAFNTIFQGSQMFKENYDENGGRLLW